MALFCLVCEDYSSLYTNVYVLRTTKYKTASHIAAEQGYAYIVPFTVKFAKSSTNSACLRILSGKYLAKMSDFIINLHACRNEAMAPYYK